MYLGRLWIKNAGIVEDYSGLALNAFERKTWTEQSYIMTGITELLKKFTRYLDLNIEVDTVPFTKDSSFYKWLWRVDYFCIEIINTDDTPDFFLYVAKNKTQFDELFQIVQGKTPSEPMIGEILEHHTRHFYNLPDLKHVQGVMSRGDYPNVLYFNNRVPDRPTNPDQNTTRSLLDYRWYTEINLANYYMTDIQQILLDTKMIEGFEFDFICDIVKGATGASNVEIVHLKNDYADFDITLPNGVFRLSDLPIETFQLIVANIYMSYMPHKRGLIFYRGKMPETMRNFKGSGYVIQFSTEISL